MRLVKTIQLGKSKIEIYSNDSEERKENLERIYDIVNKFANERRSQGIDVDQWFYSNEQLEKMQREKNYEFF